MQNPAVGRRQRIETELQALVEMGLGILKDFAETRELGLRTYQVWYTRALAVVRELLPDRNTEFVELYQPKRKSLKDLSAMSYGIADYLGGVRTVKTRYGEATDEEGFDHEAAALAKLRQQVRILESARSRLDDILSHIQGVLQAELFDNELDAARELLRGGHLRAGGAVAAVVLEGHLKDVAASHKIPAPRKTPHVSDWNDALKNGGILDIPTWRYIQHLNDLRTICVHDKGREPRPDEVEELIAGADKISKTLA